jgi:hypothetical protein
MTTPWRSIECGCKSDQVRCVRTSCMPRVKVHQYPDGTLAIFHGHRCLGRFDSAVVPQEDADKVA